MNLPNDWIPHVFWLPLPPGLEVLTKLMSRGTRGQRWEGQSSQWTGSSRHLQSRAHSCWWVICTRKHLFKLGNIPAEHTHPWRQKARPVCVLFVGSLPHRAMSITGLQNSAQPRPPAPDWPSHWTFSCLTCYKAVPHPVMKLWPLPQEDS